MTPEILYAFHLQILRSTVPSHRVKSKNARRVLNALSGDFYGRNSSGRESNLMVRRDFLQIQGVFYRSVLATNVGAALDPPGPQSAGRYHRHGQPALYMSPFPEWSISAVSGYMREDGLARVLIPISVTDAWVLDQRNEEISRLLGINPQASNGSWREAIGSGLVPGSWVNADRARASGADGIIDCSRNIPNGWHLCLFRWNEPETPQVKVCGDPIKVSLS